MQYKSLLSLTAPIVLPQLAAVEISGQAEFIQLFSQVCLLFFSIQYKCLLSLTAPIVLPQQQAAAKSI